MKKLFLKSTSTQTMNATNKKPLKTNSLVEGIQNEMKFEITEAEASPKFHYVLQNYRVTRDTMLQIDYSKLNNLQIVSLFTEHVAQVANYSESDIKALVIEIILNNKKKIGLVNFILAIVPEVFPKEDEDIRDVVLDYYVENCYIIDKNPIIEYFICSSFFDFEDFKKTPDNKYGDEYWASVLYNEITFELQLHDINKINEIEDVFIKERTFRKFIESNLKELCFSYGFYNKCRKIIDKHKSSNTMNGATIVNLVWNFNKDVIKKLESKQLEYNENLLKDIVIILKNLEPGNKATNICLILKKAVFFMLSVFIKKASALGFNKYKENITASMNVLSNNFPDIYKVSPMKKLTTKFYFQEFDVPQDLKSWETLFKAKNSNIDIDIEKNKKFLLSKAHSEFFINNLFMFFCDFKNDIKTTIGNWNLDSLLLATSLLILNKQTKIRKLEELFLKIYNTLQSSKNNFKKLDHTSYTKMADFLYNLLLKFVNYILPSSRPIETLFAAMNLRKECVAQDDSLKKALQLAEQYNNSELDSEIKCTTTLNYLLTSGFDQRDILCPNLSDFLERWLQKHLDNPYFKLEMILNDLVNIKLNIKNIINRNNDKELRTLSVKLIIIMIANNDLLPMILTIIDSAENEKLNEMIDTSASTIFHGIYKFSKVIYLSNKIASRLKMQTIVFSRSLGEYLGRSLVAKDKPIKLFDLDLDSVLNESRYSISITENCVAPFLIEILKATVHSTIYNRQNSFIKIIVAFVEEMLTSSRFSRTYCYEIKQVLKLTRNNGVKVPRKLLNIKEIADYKHVKLKFLNMFTTSHYKAFKAFYSNKFIKRNLVFASQEVTAKSIIMFGKTYTKIQDNFLSYYNKCNQDFNAVDILCHVYIKGTVLPYIKAELIKKIKFIFTEFCDFFGIYNIVALLKKIKEESDFMENNNFENNLEEFYDHYLDRLNEKTLKTLFPKPIKFPVIKRSSSIKTNKTSMMLLTAISKVISNDLIYFIVKDISHYFSSKTEITKNKKSYKFLLEYEHKSIIRLEEVKASLISDLKNNVNSCIKNSHLVWDKKETVTGKVVEKIFGNLLEINKEKMKEKNLLVPYDQVQKHFDYIRILSLNVELSSKELFYQVLKPLIVYSFALIIDSETKANFKNIFSYMTKIIRLQKSFFADSLINIGYTKFVICELEKIKVRPSYSLPNGHVINFFHWALYLALQTNSLEIAILLDSSNLIKKTDEVYWKQIIITWFVSFLRENISGVKSIHETENMMKKVIFKNFTKMDQIKVKTSYQLVFMKYNEELFVLKSILEKLNIKTKVDLSLCLDEVLNLINTEVPELKVLNKNLITTLIWEMTQSSKAPVEKSSKKNILGLKERLLGYTVFSNIPESSNLITPTELDAKEYIQTVDSLFLAHFDEKKDLEAINQLLLVSLEPFFNKSIDPFFILDLLLTRIYFNYLLVSNNAQPNPFQNFCTKLSIFINLLGTRLEKIFMFSRPEQIEDQLKDKFTTFMGLIGPMPAASEINTTKMENETQIKNKHWISTLEVVKTKRAFNEELWSVYLSTWVRQLRRTFMITSILNPSKQNYFTNLFIHLLKYLEIVERNSQIEGVLLRDVSALCLVLLHDYPRFLTVNFQVIIPYIPTYCIQILNFATSAHKPSLKMTDPFITNSLFSSFSSQKRLISEGFTSVLDLKEVVSSVEANDFTKLGTVVKEITSNFASNTDLVFDFKMRKNVYNFITSALNLVIADMKNIKGSSEGETPAGLSGDGNRVSDSENKTKRFYISLKEETSEKLLKYHFSIFKVSKVVFYLLKMGSYSFKISFVELLVNFLRFPSLETFIASVMLTQVFINAKEGDLKEIITKVLVERLISQRPHPWGILVVFLELRGNPCFELWCQEYVYKSKDMQKLFDSISKICTREYSKKT